MSGIAWCDIPAGMFTMGSAPADGHAPDSDEAPAHRVACDGIGRTPVTNAECRRFVEAIACPAPSNWPYGTIPEGRGRHPRGSSPFGALDLAGNVWEWTASAFRPSPYVSGDGCEDGTTRESRVVRGGSFTHYAAKTRCSYRDGMLPGSADHDVGFDSYASPTSRNLRCAARSKSAPGRRSPHIGFRVAGTAA